MGQHSATQVAEETPPPLTASRLETEAAAVVTATLRGEAPALRTLSAQCRDAAHELRKTLSIPLDPWADPAVAYGALLGLAETAELASRMIVRPDVLRYLIGSSEACRILAHVAAQPGGAVQQARVPGGTGIHRSNALPTLKALSGHGLIALHEVDAKATVRTWELTNEGWAAIELLRAWGLAESSATPRSVAQLLRARVPIQTLAESLAANPGAGREVGQALVAVSAQDRLRLCKAAGLGIQHFEPRRTLQFVAQLIDGAQQNARGPLGRAAQKLRLQMRGKNDEASLRAIRAAFSQLPWKTECRPMVDAVQRQLDRQANG